MDAVSFNLYAGKSLHDYESKIGIGIEKNIININDLVDIGLGMYATKDTDKLLDNVRPDVSIGVSGTLRF